MEFSSVVFSRPWTGDGMQVQLGNVLIWCADLSKRGLHKAWLYKSVVFTKASLVSLETRREMSRRQNLLLEHKSITTKSTIT